MRNLYVWWVSFALSVGAFTGIPSSPLYAWAPTPRPGQTTSPPLGDDDGDELEDTKKPQTQKTRPTAPTRAKKAAPKRPALKPRTTRKRAKAPRKKRKAVKELHVLHTPPYKARAGRKLELGIAVDGEWLVRSIQLRYRVIGSSTYKTIPFRRGEKRRYYATIPKGQVTHPGIEYFILAINLKNKALLPFATPQAPHRVYVRRLNKLGRWLAKLKRHGGTRSTLGLMGEFNSYGAHAGLRSYESPKGSNQALDAFYNLELWYTYRILGIFYQITVGYGRLRGDVPIETFDGTNTSQTILRAGLDYGFSRLYMEFHRYFGVDLKLVLGASDLGFDGGVGATIRIGNLAETHLDLGFEIISRMGWTVHFELAWDTVPWFMMALRAEVTTMPFFDDRAVASRAYFKAHIRFHKHFHAFVNIGYGRRRITPQGGPLLQVGLLANF
ncbi:MAG: hypothetical protein EP343_26170 [Deltaproteobacteria bacterium]|nr:MAG: hypothetical protein EP343_26170 [Deltaproteobacteria bacterium]